MRYTLLGQQTFRDAGKFHPHKISDVTRKYFHIRRPLPFHVSILRQYHNEQPRRDLSRQPSEHEFSSYHGNIFQKSHFPFRIRTSVCLTVLAFLLPALALGSINFRHGAVICNPSIQILDFTTPARRASLQTSNSSFLVFFAIKGFLIANCLRRPF